MSFWQYTLHGFYLYICEYIQGVPKKTESNFKFRLFKDDFDRLEVTYILFWKLVHFSF